MSEAVEKLVEQYSATLRDYLEGAGEASLKRAYDLGHQALVEGLGLLDVAAVEHRALVKGLLRARTPKEGARALEAAKEFFTEFLSPFEMAHRGFQEANAVLRRLNEMLEEQARQIAHALHDEAGQLLVVVHLALQELADELPPPARDRLREVHNLLDQIEEQLRRFSHELRPPILDDLGLVPALEFLAEGVSKRAGIPITVEGSTQGRLPPPIETALYRCVQEALTNVSKHAGASGASIHLQQETKRICCCICDDGVGFDATVLAAPRGQEELFGAGSRRRVRGLGLIGIHERLKAIGGTLEITSTAGRGTELRITVPLENRDAPAHSPR